MAMSWVRMPTVSQMTLVSDVGEALERSICMVTAHGDSDVIAAVVVVPVVWED